MGSVNALIAPVENGSADTTYRFRITDQAWADDGIDYVYFGIEVYYRIFTGIQSGAILSLTTSNQLAANGFRRIYRDGDFIDNFLMPVLYFENNDPYFYQSFKTSGYNYIDFECYLDDIINYTLTVTIKNDSGAVLDSFELKRSVFFPEGQGYDPNKVDTFKGFNEFEQTDADINGDIWTEITKDIPVYLILYVYSYGYSLDPNHLWAKIESPLENVGQLQVRCKEYLP